MFFPSLSLVPHFRFPEESILSAAQEFLCAEHCLQKCQERSSFGVELWVLLVAGSLLFVGFACDVFQKPVGPCLKNLKTSLSSLWANSKVACC